MPMFTLARGLWSMGGQMFSYSTRSGFVLRTILATLLVCGLMAAPAFAQDTTTPGGTDNPGDNKANVLNCSQVQSVVANQYNNGDAIAISQYGDAIAAIAQILGISQNQVQNCLVNISGGAFPGKMPPGMIPPGKMPPGKMPPGVTPPGGKMMPPGDVGKPGAVVPGTKSKIPLPNTGGVTPLSGMGVGIVAIAAGILSAVAIVRRGR